MTRTRRLRLEPLDQRATPSAVAPPDLPTATDAASDTAATVSAALAADTRGVALAFLIVPNWQAGSGAG